MSEGRPRGDSRFCVCSLVSEVVCVAGRINSHRNEEGISLSGLVITRGM
jgi:hypothetical protein